MDFSFAEDPNLTEDEKAEALVGAIMLEYPDHSPEWYEALLERMVWANEHDLDMSGCPVVMPED